MTDLTQFGPLDREQVEEELQWCAPPMLLWLAWQSPRSAASRLSALISARRSVLRLADPSQENSVMTFLLFPRSYLSSLFAPRSSKISAKPAISLAMQSCLPIGSRRLL